MCTYKLVVSKRKNHPTNKRLSPRASPFARRLLANHSFIWLNSKGINHPGCHPSVRARPSSVHQPRERAAAPAESEKRASPRLSLFVGLPVVPSPSAMPPWRTARPRSLVVGCVRGPTACKHTPTRAEGARIMIVDRWLRKA